MAVHQAVVLVLALTALVLLPCAIAVLICADGLWRWLGDRFGRRSDDADSAGSQLPATDWPAGPPDPLWSGLVGGWEPIAPYEAAQPVGRPDEHDQLETPGWWHPADLIGRWQRVDLVGRLPRFAALQERWTLIRLDRAVEHAIAQHRSGAGADEQSRRTELSRLPIEQIALDLSRLDRQRLSLANRSRVWHVALQRAYDDRLRLACDCLAVPQHLAELDGIDLEIERLRVEGALHAVGLSFGASDADRREGHG